MKQSSKFFCVKKKQKRSSLTVSFLCYTFLNFLSILFWSLSLSLPLSGFIIPLIIVIKEKLADYTQM